MPLEWFLNLLIHEMIFVCPQKNHFPGGCGNVCIWLLRSFSAINGGLFSEKFNIKNIERNFTLEVSNIKFSSFIGKNRSNYGSQKANTNMLLMTSLSASPNYTRKRRKNVFNFLFFPTHCCESVEVEIAKWEWKKDTFCTHKNHFQLLNLWNEFIFYFYPLKVKYSI